MFKRFVFQLVVVVAAFAAGWVLYPRFSPVHPDAGAEASDDPQPLYWVAPMDANYRRDKPGKSPMGMDLVPVYEEAGGGMDDGGITLSPRVIQNLGVRTAPATRGQVTGTINSVGRVVLAEEDIYHVHSRVSGWVEKLHLSTEGMQVKAGQVMFEFFSPQLQGAQEDFLLAHRSNNTRLKQAAYNNLLALGVTADQIDALARRGTARTTIQLHARAGGYLQELKVREGMYVEPAMEIAAIAGLDEVWVEAEVFERRAAYLEAGQPVAVTLAAFPGETWQGRVDYLYPDLNTDTRTLRARIRLPNPDRRLQPGMFASLDIAYNLGDDLLTVPVSAVIRDGRQDRVIIAEGDGRFRPAPVKVGPQAGDRLVILEGLEENTQVVTSAQFLIDSETNIDAAMARLTEPEPDGTGPISGTGRVEMVMADIGLITLTHEPIPELNWPTMTMDFETDPGLDLTEVREGDMVTFELAVTPDGDYRILQMQSTHPSNHEGEH